MVLFATKPSSCAFTLLSSPSSPPSISFSTAFATSSFTTNTPTLSSSPHLTGNLTPTRTPMPQTSTMIFSFKNCSANMGQTALAAQTGVEDRLWFHGIKPFQAFLRSVDHHTISTGLSFVLMAPNIIEVRQSDERSRQLSFGDMNVHRQAGDREFLHIRFHGEVRLMQQNVVRTQQRKTPHPVENQPGHLEFPRRFRRPGQTFIRYNAARRRIVRNAVEILAEFREAHLLAGEWDFQEVNFQAGSPEIPRESRRVLWGSYQANFRAVAGQQPGHVDHGNHVALRQQRD
nr:hypothetical protein KK1_010225 [Ipomoea batatas]